MYGFNITVSLAGEKPGNLGGMLDEVTDQLTIMCSREAQFEDFMVTRHLSGDTTFLIVVSGPDEALAMTQAITWLHTAVNAAGFGTPGWLRRAEQVFTEDSPGQAVAAGC
jgi:hypothetical protein